MRSRAENETLIDFYVYLSMRRGLLGDAILKEAYSRLDAAAGIKRSEQPLSVYKICDSGRKVLVVADCLYNAFNQARAILPADTKSLEGERIGYCLTEKDGLTSPLYSDSI